MRRVLACFLTAAALLAFDPAHADAPPIGIWTSPPRSFSTASYWIEGPVGLVLVDTQFLPPEGVRAVEAAERASGKKVVLAIVLHPNPDKFNGTAALQGRGIRVITARQVADRIAAVHAIRLGWFGVDYAPDYPKDAAHPDVFGDRTTTISAAGLALTLHVLGVGSSAAHVVVQAGDAVFVGDLVNPDNHAWLELGQIDDWLARLEEIRALRPKTIYPGRGKPGGTELLDRQAAYLTRVQSLVRAEVPSGELRPWVKWRLQFAIEGEFPALAFPIFMREGLAAVWKTEAGRRR